jgi:hypothetical protein
MKIRSFLLLISAMFLLFTGIVMAGDQSPGIAWNRGNPVIGNTPSYAPEVTTRCRAVQQATITQPNTLYVRPQGSKIETAGILTLNTTNNYKYGLGVTKCRTVNQNTSVFNLVTQHNGMVQREWIQPAKRVDRVALC